MGKSLTPAQSSRLFWYLERGLHGIVPTLPTLELKPRAPIEDKIVFFVDPQLDSFLPEDEFSMLKKMSAAAFGEKQKFKVVRTIEASKTNCRAIVILGCCARIIQETAPFTVEIYHPQKMKRDLQLKIPTWNILKQMNSKTT